MDFKQVFEHVPEALVLISPDMKILGASNVYLETTMRSREDLLGKHFLLEAFPEPTVSYEDNPVRISIEKAIQTKKKEWLDVLRYDIARPDGTGYDVRFWEASHTPVMDAQGEVLYVIQETKDVTERENAKRALQESEHKFRFMADSMPQLIDANNVDGESNYFSKQWENYTGIPVQQLMQGRWKEAIHPDDLIAAETLWQQALHNGEACQLEIRIRDKDGDYRWFLNRYLPMQDEAGKIIMWIGSCNDIHDMKNMVEELLASNEQMSELSDQVQLAYRKAENERLTIERLFMQAPAFFCILKGPQHRYELINEKYQALFPHLDLIGRTVAEALPEVAEQGFVDLLDKVYNTGESFLAEDITVKIANAEGILEDKHVTFIYQAHYDEQDQIVGILVFGYDVSDKFALKQKLEQLSSAE
ncbi:PAS domain-containing protein [Pontibacter sp. JH31]|uniref:histidine kinase n=1 Tax=Pontibacter aquaedesilientis TaxID=2766980 RepID=A0ABR7XE00_9BACT|nr:PAS domain-containing protein [Pontibacter aquaedesilientis]MBD1395833.1 PAS domain-containing protein [Pontibacter aquaedesilientis]